MLGKLDSARRSKDRGYEISDQVTMTSHKFMGRVEQMFRNLPNPLEWRAFYNNDLPLLIDFCKNVREASVEHHLKESLRDEAKGHP